MGAVGDLESKPQCLDIGFVRAPLAKAAYARPARLTSLVTVTGSGQSVSVSQHQGVPLLSPGGLLAVFKSPTNLQSSVRGSGFQHLCRLIVFPEGGSLGVLSFVT